MQKKMNFKNADDDIGTLFDQISSDNICANEHLYGEGYQDNEDMMTIRWLYIVLVNILLLLEQVQMIRIFLVRNKNVFCLYEALGMSEKRKRKVFFGWMFCVLFISMMLSYGIALLLGGAVASLLSCEAEGQILNEVSSVYGYFLAIIAVLFVALTFSLTLFAQCAAAV